MSYRVEIKNSAASQIKKLHKDLQTRVMAKLRQLGETPRPNGVQKLQGEDNLYRVRVGDFRVVYSLSDEPPLVLILSVADRKEVYR